MTKKTEPFWGECQHCWGPFIGRRTTKKYCSDKCKQEAYLRRKKEPKSITITIVRLDKKPSLRSRVAKLFQKLANIPF